MLAVRQSPETERREVEEQPRRPRESNSRWLARVAPSDGLLFLGGASVADFRVRVAQSHARTDMRPSLWSSVGILRDGVVTTVSLNQGDPADVPERNAVQSRPVRDFDSAALYPNVAVATFTTDQDRVLQHLRHLQAQRTIVDLPSLVLEWLAYVWGAGEGRNPLLAGKGEPSAVFVATLYGLAGVELAPGLSTGLACPEVIWQAVRYWSSYYEQPESEPVAEHQAPTVVPKYVCVLGQRRAAVGDPPSRGSGDRAGSRSASR
jgi:hypothetical protein